MEWHFALPGSPGSSCRLQKTFWLGRLRLSYGGRPVARSKEPGKPFLVPLPDGRTARVIVKANGLDYLPKLEVEGHPVLLGRPLSTLEYALGGLPLVLMFAGGALGGLAGGLGALCNYRLPRTERAQTVKVLGVIGVTAASAGGLGCRCAAGFRLGRCGGVQLCGRGLVPAAEARFVRQRQPLLRRAS